MASKRIHLAKNGNEPLCGVRSREPLVSSDHTEVTCKDCLSRSAPLEAFDRPFYSKIAGVSYSNRDGGSRQQIIGRCHVGERLILRAEPDNPVDRNAVCVLRENGEQLGYLGAREAADLQGYLLAGQSIPCCIADVTGGGSLTRGVNIRIGAWESPEGEAVSGQMNGVARGWLIVLILVVLGLVVVTVLKRE